MPSYIAEAIEIITDDGTGIPNTYTNTAIGLASDGHFYLVTDRFGLNGTPTVSGDTSRQIWYQGVLLRDDSSFTISRTANFIEAGCMASVSSLSFSIDNTGAFWNLLKANGVYLGRRKVKYYRVTASDLAGPFDFELRWSGVIDEFPFDEMSQKVNCVDNSKEIFKSLPPRDISKSNFPLVPPDSIDKQIPIVIGRVAYSPLVNVSGAGDKVVMCKVGSVDYTVAAGLIYTAGTDPNVNLYTPNATFTLNDSRLVGKYLKVISGGVSQFVRIWNNVAYNPATTTTIVYIEAPLDVSTPFLGWTIGSASANVWYFEVVDLSPSLIASTKSIYEIKDGDYGQDGLYAYSSESKAFNDISEIKLQRSLTNIKSTGYPGFSIVSQTFDSETELKSYTSIVPSAVSQYSNTSWTSNALPAIGTSAPYLFDRSKSTGYSLTQLVIGSSVKNVVFSISLPSKKELISYDNLYILFNMDHFSSSVALTGLIQVTAQALDIFGRAITSQVSSETIFNGSVPSSSTSFNLLPESYFNNPTGSDATFHTYKSALDISSVIDDSTKVNAFNSIRLTITFALFATAETYATTIKEIGLIGKRGVATTAESIFTPIVGETFGTTWEARKEIADPILKAVDAYEHLIRNYDHDADIWRVGKAYSIGDKVRESTDNVGHVFVCTVAGTSHATTEPTWTQTTGATYTDNTVTWRELYGIPIDQISFDAATVYRNDWHIGRTIIDKKKSEEYYKELCTQTFLISDISPDGSVRVKSWLDDTSPDATFNSANILAGSIGDMTLSPMRQTYNEILIRYDWNPGSKSFNKQLSVNHADSPSFPAITDLLVPASPLVLASIAYTYWGWGAYYFTVTTTGSHGLVTGDFASLLGNTHNYDFTNLPVSVVSTTVFNVASYTVPTATTSTTGTLTHPTNTTLKWPTYVGGVTNYAKAKTIWDDFHASYAISRSINKLPENIGDCYWFFDPYAKNQSGRYIWQTGTTLDLDVGDEHSAVFLLEKLARWTGYQKKQVTCELPDTSTYSDLNLGDPVYFNDAKLTAGVDLLGWIHEKTQLPRDETRLERFRFGITFSPEQYVDSYIIDEEGATDIIDEDSATNIYDEEGA